MSGLCICSLPSRFRACLVICCAVAAVLGAASGCQSVPRLRSPAGAAWITETAAAPTGELLAAQRSAVPDFDLPAESSRAVAVTEPVAIENAGPGNVTSAPARETPATEATVPQGSTAVSVPADPIQSGRVTTATVSAAPAPSSATDSSVASAAAAKLPATVTGPTVVTAAAAAAQGLKTPSETSLASPTSAATAQLAKAEGQSTVDSPQAPSGKQEPVVNQLPRSEAAAAKPATVQDLPAYSERRPEAFAWRRTGRTAGGRPFEISLTGENGFRTLFIGSAVGNDPISMKLMDRLARQLHENGLIMGGFEAAVIHTLNPDGAASGQPTNALGRYVNGRFPLQPDQKPVVSTPEVDFLLGCIRSFRPQRIVHVRTIGDSAGVIACNDRCLETVEQIAEALKFSRLSIPAQTREGSLEHCLAAQKDLDVITLALPRGELAEADAWALYGDTLLNLLRPQAAGGREAHRAVTPGAAKSP